MYLKVWLALQLAVGLQVTKVQSGRTLDDREPAVHEDLFRLATHKSFGRRRIYDTRLALPLRRQGVTAFATANVRDLP